MDVELLNTLKRCDKKYNVDEISLKDKLTNCAHQITNVEYAGFTPIASHGFKFINFIVLDILWAWPV